MSTALFELQDPNEMLRTAHLSDDGAYRCDPVAGGGMSTVWLALILFGAVAGVVLLCRYLDDKDPR